MSHGTHVIIFIWMSMHIHSFIWMSHGTHIHDRLRHSCICVPWLIRMSYKYDHMCAMTYSYACHDSFICVPWLIYMCAMTHSYVCHDSFICHINMVICVPWAPPTLLPKIKHILYIHIYVYIIIYIIHIYMYVCIHIYTYTLQWLLFGVMSHRVIWQFLMKVLPNMNESCHTYE